MKGRKFSVERLLADGIEELQVGMDHVMQQFVSIEDPEIVIAFQGHVPSVGDLMSCVDWNTFKVSGYVENLN